MRTWGSKTFHYPEEKKTSPRKWEHLLSSGERKGVSSNPPPFFVTQYASIEEQGS